MSEEQIILWEEALKPIVKVFLILLPYTLIAFFLNKIGFMAQVYVVSGLFGVSILLVLIDFLLQNFLDQPFMFKLISLFLLAGAIYFSYATISWSYLQLLSERTDTNTKIAMGIQVFLILYWIYSGIKSFANTLWELDLA